ncbi:NAD-dependent succinate-semialdehyde dehydrogenase [Glutamicibacter uratoxydans]|uniref:NAD-dependent succinate-semialdehyde dehydrogenase n=1 Tax=Glutamicibacter uratoxydans TaxID=43667 RepID=UPI003D6DFD51
MSPATITTRNPATGEQLADYPTHDMGQLQDIIAASATAQHGWSRLPVADRAAAVARVARVLRDNVEEHAQLITAEMGKPITEARSEVLKCASTVEYYAQHAEHFLAPRGIDTQAKSSFVAYEPLGVIFAVMPWNYPYWQVIRFAIPALIAGNGALLKHAANVTGAAHAINSVFEQSGLPRGLFGVLVPQSHEMVSTIIEDPRISAVTLTGSEAAGKAIGQAAGRALKKCVLELGGSDPFVVLEDVPDLESIIPQAVTARFGNTGQSCLCAKRFIVVDELYDRFVHLATKAVRELELGDPGAEGTNLGPLAKEQFVEEIHALVQDSVDDGAVLETGGERRKGPGYYYQPTVLSEVTAGMPVFRRETFGPVMPIIRARDEAHAIELANDTIYGLGATVWTGDMDRGLRVGRQITSGVLFVNGVAASDPRLPFGGLKSSGYGRELSVEGLREFTNVRTVWAAELNK